MPTYTRSLADDLRQDSDIHFRLVDNVAFLMIDRQPENNRLTPASLAHIAQIAQTLAVDPRTNCVVVSAEGVEHFSSGIFNAELRAGYSKEDILAIVKLANDAFDGLQALPQIVIGALNGAVRAGGGSWRWPAISGYAQTMRRWPSMRPATAAFPGPERRSV